MTTSSEETALAVTFDDIEAAAERLEGQAHHTPVCPRAASTPPRASALVQVRAVPARRGVQVSRRLQQDRHAASAEQRARGMIAFSRATTRRRCRCRAALRRSRRHLHAHRRAEVKVVATRGYGAEIVRYDRHDRGPRGAGPAAGRGARADARPALQRPGHHRGAGTAARELLQDVPDLDVIAAPTGGGGLLSGTAIAAHGHAARHHGRSASETEAANHAWLSLQQGERVQHPATRHPC